MMFVILVGYRGVVIHMLSTRVYPIFCLLSILFGVSAVYHAGCIMARAALELTVVRNKGRRPDRDKPLHRSSKAVSKGHPLCLGPKARWKIPGLVRPT